MFLVLINSILLLIKLSSNKYCFLQKCRASSWLTSIQRHGELVNWTGVAGRRRLKVHYTFKAIMEPFRRNGTSLWTIPTNCGWDKVSVCGHLEDRGGSLYPGRLCSRAWPAWPESLPAPLSRRRRWPGPVLADALQRARDKMATQPRLITLGLTRSQPKIRQRRERESSVSFIVWFASQIVFVYLTISLVIQSISVFYPREPLLYFEWGVLPMKQILVV